MTIFDNFLSVLMIVPMIGAFFVWMVRSEGETTNNNIRIITLITTLVTFIMSLVVWAGFDNASADFQFVEKASWFGDTINYHLGVDGISLLFVILTTFLMPLVILSTWESVDKRLKEFMIAFLVLESLMIGVFVALDIFLFYVFFEGGLIPMFLIIGVWGGANRIYASYKFFLYTLLGSVFMLIAILWMVTQAGTTDIPLLMNYHFDPGAQNWLWLAFFASFAVKMPMWPVHTWLPDAHVEAPTAGSMILAGVLLKMGGYGFLRFSLPMFPIASDHFSMLIMVLSVIAVIYTSLVALVQTDMKKLIAYSSVAHMGFVTIGIFVLNQQGIEGAIFQMLSHGVVSAALFFSVGVVYDRLHTREIARYGGLANNMKRYAVFFMIFTLASVGLPATSGFVGEVLVLFGAYEYSSWLAFFAATGVILGATYMLMLARSILFGELTKDDVKAMPDISKREFFIFAPMVAVVFWMGVYPNSFLEPMHASVEKLINQHHIAVSSVHQETVE